VILDRLAAGMPAEEITAEYPMVTVAGVGAAAAYGAALAREELLRRRSHGEVQARREPARLVCRDLELKIVGDSMCHEVEARSNVNTGTARSYVDDKGLTRWPES
jgi:Protein of unknown function (DUF433)